MPALKLEEFGTKLYSIYFAPNTGGCFFIQCTESGQQTNLFTGSEGLEDYKQLKRAYRKRHKIFNDLCAEYIPLPILNYIENHKGE